MIKILHIIQEIDAGGVERRRLSIAKKLDKTKYQMKLICLGETGILADQIRSLGVEVIVLEGYKGPLDFKSYRKVRNIVKEFKPQIIHGAVFEGVGLASVTGFLERVPTIIIEETSFPKNRSWRGHLLMRFYALLSHRVVSISKGVTHYLVDYLKINTQKVIQINNGVRKPRQVTELETQVLKDQLGLGVDDFVFVSAGRMRSDDLKRFSDLAEATRIAVLKYPKLKLVLVGKGDYYSVLQEFIATHNLQSNIILVGFQDDMDLYYSLADVFCLVSEHEAFGLVSAEAMLMGKPCILSKVGGLQFNIVEGENGWLVPSKDVAALAKQMEYCITHPEVVKSFGKSALIHANENHTEDRYVGQLFKFYQECIQIKK